MSWVVRVDRVHEDAGSTADRVDTIETMAIMAETTGIAEVSDPDGLGLIVGFDTESDARRFRQSLLELGFAARAHPITTADDWTIDELSTIATPSGMIELEIGTSFGHGGHPTTRLALDALDRLPVRSSMLDVGSGSGVLSLAAASAGWTVAGCDIDPEAVRIATSNAVRNGLDDRTSFVCATPTQLASPDHLRRSAGFDLAVVNTLVTVHEAEAAAIVALVNRDAPIVVTGIRGRDQSERTRAAYGREISDSHEYDGWTLLVLTHSS